MLSIIIFLPAVGAVLVMMLGRDPRVARSLALAIAGAELALTLVLFATFDREAVDGYDLVERANWVSAFGIQYLLGVDGLSAPLVMLNGLLGVAAVLVSWRVATNARGYFAWLLILQTSVMGVFLSLDLILFFVFWELELVPMYFLIAMWGTGRREYSAMKFFVYTFLGSAFMFAAIIALYFSFPSAERTFDITVLAQRELTSLIVPASTIFAGFLIAFAVKLPIFPLHTWLPDAHTDAPTAVSVMLAGVLLKMGGYGLLRINAGLFPDELRRIAPLLAGLAVVNVLYGAFIVMRQTDLKRLIAYSSVSHMGFVVLGVASLGASQVTAVGINGAAMQLFTHGTITGLLFVLVGLVYERTHTRHIPDMGGMIGRMPLIGAAFVLAGLASLGLPMTSGFVAEILVFLGTFHVYAWATGLAAFGVVLAAGYILWTIQRTMFGPRLERWNGLQDATIVDAGAIGVLLVPVMVVGIYPRFLTDAFESGLAPILARFG
jgi:NADH-quinone oxidoreductase subunit M